MISSFDLEKLKKLLKDFYVAVGIRVSVFDDDFHLVAEYPETAPEFCSLIRMTDKGLTGCHHCDRQACIKAKELRGPYLYQCHAGLYEAITPIQLGEGVLGYAILAHLMPKENYEETLDTMCERTRAYGLEKDQILPVAKKLKIRSKEQIDASIHLLDAFSSYIYLKNIVTWKEKDISKRMDEYINVHIQESISSEDICDEFGIGRTKLYQISMKSFGMGISQYVSLKRIEKAKELLRDTDSSIANIAYQTGFVTYSYFCKTFRKKVGVSPSLYRKRQENPDFSSIPNC